MGSSIYQWLVACFASGVQISTIDARALWVDMSRGFWREDISSGC